MKRITFLALGLLCAGALALDQPSHAGGEVLTPVRLGTIPEASFTDQNGVTRRLWADTLKDQVVAVNFIFTSCPSICPPMGAAFAELQHRVAQQKLNVRFVSISIDPSTDTPQRLSEWAAKFGGTSAWILLTGPKASVDAVEQALGVQSAVNTHTPVVLLGNTKDGRWLRANALAPPDQLAAALAELSRPARP